MPRVLRSALALALLCLGTLTGTTMSTAPAVDAASVPWTLPTSPPPCSKAQADSGDVAGCVITLVGGLPESRGWPQPPFPQPSNQTVTTWVDLTIGATGPTVAKVQGALITSGATLFADGKYGAQTFAAVKAFQTAHKLPVTGVTNKATADLLKVQRLTGGTFPPKGWVWLGWGYNGSPALAAWEKLLVGNPTQIGYLKPGQLKALPDALPLFMGFYNEIQARGYVVHDGGPYVFRCTASTRKDCAGLTRYALSNHAYGLAQDINTAANPMKRYVSSGTKSACSVPVTTDMPKWVIQTAEKWGLYWGGYAWSSGCQSPTTWRTSVTRDPMHFEFNGSPAQARAILKKASSLPCFDEVTTKGTAVLKCLQKGEVPAAGTRLAITTKAPAGATAALVQLYASSVAADGVITAESCGAHAAVARSTITLAAPAGRGTSGLAVVPLDTTHRFCLYQSVALHTTVTVQGYFSPSASAPAGLLFTPAPSDIRTFDSSTTGACTPAGTCLPAGPLPAGTEAVSAVASHLSPVAVLANVTVTAPTASGSLFVGSCSNQATGVLRRAGSLYVAQDASSTTVNLVRTFATEMGDQFCTMSTQTGQQKVDVSGFFAPVASGGSGFAPTTPTRVVDTTQCWTDPVSAVERCNQPVRKGALVRVKAPAGATAVLLHVSAVGSTPDAGELQAAACPDFFQKVLAGTVAPVASGVRHGNLVAVPIGPDGNYCVRTTVAAHLAIDLVGTFSPTADLRFLPVTPARILDTRPRA